MINYTADSNSKPWPSLKVKARSSYEELESSNAALKQVVRDLHEEKEKLFRENCDLRNSKRIAAPVEQPTVEFRLVSDSLASSRLQAALKEVFKLDPVPRGQDLVLHCGLEQFVRFLIVRDQCGANNSWKQLRAKLIYKGRDRPAQRFDFTGGFSDGTSAGSGIRVRTRPGTVGDPMADL